MKLLQVIDRKIDYQVELSSEELNVMELVFGKMSIAKLKTVLGRNSVDGEDKLIYNMYCAITNMRRKA